MSLVSSLSALKDANEKVEALLSDLFHRGETVEEVVALVRFLDDLKVRVEVPKAMKVFDVCGTGGTGKRRMNLSTALTVKLAEEFAIAKHGNKASAGRCGSFDIVERSNMVVATSPEIVLDELKKHNRAFVFAPAFHPFIGLVTMIRKKLDHPTIFNLVGPLLNPVDVTAQMIGVKDSKTAKLLAEACAVLGKNALLVHDTVFGLDDVSIGGETKYFKVVDGQIEEGTFVPEDFGIERVNDFDQIAGTDTIEGNLKLFHDLLSEKATVVQQSFLDINYKVAKDFFLQF